MSKIVLDDVSEKIEKGLVIEYVHHNESEDYNFPEKAAVMIAFWMLEHKIDSIKFKWGLDDEQ